MPAAGASSAASAGTVVIALSSRLTRARLLLDAGTGLHVARLLDGAVRVRCSSAICTDHTQGLPFFTAGDRADARSRYTSRSPGAIPALDR
jgi:hypothetical protein